MFLLVGAALAHVPHDNALSLVAPPDASASEPWFLLLNPQGVYLWLRSDDAGRTWSMVGGEQLEVDPLGAARTTDGGIAWLGEDEILWSTDQGVTWTSSELPGAVDTIRGGDDLILAGVSGLYRGRPDTGWTRELTDSIALLGPNAAWSNSAGAYALRDGWQSLGLPDGVSVTGIADDGTELWIGTTDGTVEHFDGTTWSTCVPLPSAEAEHNDVVRLVWDGEHIVVATGTAGPFSSADRCATWDTTTNGIEIDYGSGGAENDARAFTFLESLGGTWAIGGWAGFQLSADQGATWSDPALVPSDYTRGLAFDMGWPVETRLYVGAYAAAVQYTDDGGLTWAAPNSGLDTTNTQRVKVDRTDPATLYAIVDHIGWVSHDQGVSWERYGPDGVGNIEEVYTFSTPQKAWIASTSVYETVDGGTTWEERTDLTDIFGDSHLTGVLEMAERICITVAEPTGFGCSTDGGETWTMRLTETTGRTSSPVSWPPETPEVILWGDSLGIHREHLDSGLTDEIEAPPIEEMVAATDGTLFAFSRGGALLKSTDGGETFDPVGDRLPAHVHSALPRPDWEEVPEVVVGTHDGVYVGSPDGEWRRVGYQRIDDASPMFLCTGCGERVVDDTRGCSRITPVPEAAVVAMWMRGTHVAVEGLGGGGGADLAIDDVDYGPFGASGDGRLVQVDGLADGWHELHITGLAGSTLQIDAIEAWDDTPGLVFPEDPPIPEEPDTAITSTVDPLPVDTGDTGDDTGEKEPPGKRCGCATAGGLGWSWVLVAALSRRASRGSRRAAGAGPRGCRG